MHSEDVSPSTLDLIRADPRFRTRDDDGVGAIVIGTIAWTIALVVMVAFGSHITDADSWTRVCLMGALLGIPGIAIVLLRRRRRARS